MVEDIKAVIKGNRRWDVMFSPLQVGAEEHLKDHAEKLSQSEIEGDCGVT